LKNSISLITLLVFCICCSAQHTIVDVSNKIDWTTNTYLKDTNNHFEDVLGTWKWEEGNSSFEIEFTKITNYNYEGINMAIDFILARYKYVKDGFLVADILNNIYDPLNFKATLVFDNPTEYIFIINDVVSDKTKKGQFKLSSNGLDTIATYSLRNLEGMYVNQSNIEFSLPTQLTLVKK
tara:strand:- start:128084 stop:128623 length:540 start_codon:yes stop_codon:yes gene_type:complete